MTWTKYEDVARELLDRFRDDLGLSGVEGKQILTGNATNWEIDAKGYRASDGSKIIVECRRYTTSRDNQRNLAGLSYTIMDTGSAGGIHVSPLGLQEGAERIAAAENIIEVHLNADATPEEFQMKFLDKLMIGLMDTVSVTVTDSLRVTHFDEHGNVISDEDINLEGQ